MFKEPVIYVDIETTGISHHSSRIIEIAAIRVENDQIVDTFKTLINPGSPIPYHITRLTGITTNDIQDAPFFEEIADKLNEILSSAIFIAHNVRFDYSFIKKQLELCNIRYTPRMLCSVRMSRALYPSQKKHNLQTIINTHGLSAAKRHRAYDDALAIKHFFEIAHKQHGADAFSAAVAKQLKHKSAPPNIQMGEFDFIPNTIGVYTFYDEDNIPIYIGKSITLRKRVMSHFAQDTSIDKEMKLSLNTHRISYVESANELEALLLESKMIKEHLPVYNRKLRRQKCMYVLTKQYTDTGHAKIQTLEIKTDEINPDNSIYGAFSSRTQAKSVIENIQKTFDLCPKLLGLEKAKDACFKHQLHKCRGACINQENAETYNLRFEIAFERNKIAHWPYVNPIVLEHINHPTSKKLVLDNWSVIGEIQADEGCEPYFKRFNMNFDLDSYKIIRSYLSQKKDQYRLHSIPYSQLNALAV